MWWLIVPAVTIAIIAAAALVRGRGTPPGTAKSPPAARNAPSQDIWFREVAARAGLDFHHVSGQKPSLKPGQRLWFPQIMGGGACLFDYDNDGDMDLYLVQSGSVDPGAPPGPGNQLYRNKGNGTFEDVTGIAGVGDVGYGMGCTCGDYDNDGFTDLYVTNVGPNTLYHNKGDGTFEDVTAASGTGHPGWGASAAFLDYNDDGLADLFVTNYVYWSHERERDCRAQDGQLDYCTPSRYGAAPDVLFRNEGDGEFVDMSDEAGLGAAFGNGLGVACGDFNLDGRIDIYVANDQTLNQLWINEGNGHFTDDALLAGCALNAQGSTEAGMGVAAIDIDSDGDLDLFMSHLRGETNTLYINEGGLFEDTTAVMGLASASMIYTGFGLGFADFDHDGRVDLYVADGRVALFTPRDPHDPYAEENLLFRRLEDGRFEEVTPRGGVARPLVGTSRGTALGDIDNDGDIDIVIVEKDGPVHMLENVIGSKKPWIEFRLLNSHGSDAVGATVEIRVAGVTRHGIVQPAYGYQSCNDPRVHFGLGSSSDIQDVSVTWRTGRTTSFGALPAGRIHTLRESDTP